MLLHPTKQNIVICGQFNGAVQVFDINFKERKYILKFSATKDSLFHTSEIIYLEWLTIKLNGSAKLVS